MSSSVVLFYMRMVRERTLNCDVWCYLISSILFTLFVSDRGSSGCFFRDANTRRIISGTKFELWEHIEMNTQMCYCFLNVCTYLQPILCPCWRQKIHKPKLYVTHNLWVISHKKLMNRRRVNSKHSSRVRKIVCQIMGNLDNIWLFSYMYFIYIRARLLWTCVYPLSNCNGSQACPIRSGRELVHSA